MTRRGVMAATVVCLLAGCGGGGNASQTQTESATNGHIAFERLRFQNSPLWGELFVMNADGTGVRKLTLPPNGTEDTNPDWSPDGSRLVFERAPSTGAHSIWTVNSDGTGLRRLTPDCPPGAGVPTCRADDGWPVWSPDGKHIAFQRLTGALRPNGATVNDAKAIYKDELTIMDADGGHTRTLFWLGPWRGDPQAPAWSPDGKRLVFVGKFMNSKTNGTGCECRALYVIDVDGSGLNRILPPGVEPGGRMEWSPDGSVILFRTHPGDDSSGVGANLYTIHPDGVGLHQLTHFSSAEHVLEGSYSPDGRSIVFETSSGAVGSALPDIFEMDADGEGLHQITRTRNFETEADWGP